MSDSSSHRQETEQQPEKSYQGSQHAHHSSTSKSRSHQLKEVILKNQNTSQKGYYTFQEWRNVHEVMFTLNESHITSTVINCWRMLKLINFGDDYVPTGLVYDTLMTVINVDETVEQTEVLLKSIFFKFIEFNGKYLSEKEKSQLTFFKVVRNIVQGYRKIITDNLNFHDEEAADKSEKGASESGKSADRNQQLYKLHNVFVYKKNLEKLRKIEDEFKQCSFEPRINENSSQMGQSRYLKDLIKKSQKSIQQQGDNPNQFGIIDEAEEFANKDGENSQMSYCFKANPVPNYPEQNPLGISQHLERMQRSREIRKINSLENSLKVKHPQNHKVQEFSIDQRASERKLRQLKNCRILFMVKVEVGKHLYRIKVRENMTVSDTVKAIESMVGFKDSVVEDVIKGYFMNWQNRQRLKQQKANHHSNNKNIEIQQFEDEEPSIASYVSSKGKI